MRIVMVTTIRTTTTEPYTQLPPDRIDLRLSSTGMVFLPNMAELQEMHPTFFKMCEHEEILPRTGDPIQLDSVLLRGLREKVGIRIETDDITEAAALLNIDEEDPIFRSEHSKAHPS